MNFLFLLVVCSEYNNVYDYESGKYVNNSYTYKYDIDISQGEYDTMEKKCDSRDAFGDYYVKKVVQIDHWGGYKEESLVYSGLMADEKLTDEKLTRHNVFVRNYSNKDDNEYWSNTINLKTGEEKTEYGCITRVERDREHGYVTKRVYDFYDGYSGTLLLSRKETIAYDDYKLYPTSTGIRSAQATSDDSAKRVYTLDGVYVGDTMEGLPGGMYVVKEGTRSRKILK